MSLALLRRCSHCQLASDNLVRCGQIHSFIIDLISTLYYLVRSASSQAWDPYFHRCFALYVANKGLKSSPLEPDKCRNVVIAGGLLCVASRFDSVFSSLCLRFQIFPVQANSNDNLDDVVDEGFTKSWWSRRESLEIDARREVEDFVPGAPNKAALRHWISRKLRGSNVSLVLGRKPSLILEKFTLLLIYSYVTQVFA